MLLGIAKNSLVLKESDNWLDLLIKEGESVRGQLCTTAHVSLKE